MINQKHEIGCWTGKVERIVLGMEPAYAPDFDDDQPCLECMDIRAQTLPARIKSWFRRL